MNSTDLRALWDRETAKYADRSSALGDFPLPEEFLPRPGGKVLDAGCGGGNYLGMYRQIAGGEVFGLDFSGPMAKAAARYGRTVQGDVQRLPFKSGAFAYVSSHVVINHVPDSRAALAELARVTRAGGRVVVVVPNRLSFVSLERMLMMRLGKYSLGPCRHYTLPVLRAEGSAHGLAVRRFFTIPKVPTAPAPLRRAASWLGYIFDRIVRAVYPRGGGDLAVLFEKLEGPVTA